MSKIRVIRVLVYEGSESWVKMTLGKSVCQPHGPGPQLGNGFKIYERERYLDMGYIDPDDEPSAVVGIVPGGLHEKG